MELPLETESYVHRIGRTARAGGSGIAISFVSPQERGQLKAVERFIKKTIRIDDEHPFSTSAPADIPWIKNPAEIQRRDRPSANKKPQHKNRRRNKDGKKNPSFKGRRQPDFGKRVFN
jgi:ATP-dependent RNA helicase RhlE